MKNNGLRKLSTVSGRDRLPSPTFVQQPQGFSRIHSFQTKPCQRCSHRYVAVLWHGPSGILLSRFQGTSRGGSLALWAFATARWEPAAAKQDTNTADARSTLVRTI